MNFQKQPKRNFNLTEENQLLRLEKNLKSEFKISWSNYRSFYLKDLENDELIGRWSNHNGSHGEDFNFIFTDFQDMINSFKKFTEKNNLIQTPWKKFKAKKENLLKYLLEVKKKPKLKIKKNFEKKLVFLKINIIIKNII